MALSLIAALILSSPQQAISGDLEPSSGPAPTMHSLDELYDKLISIENKVTGNCSDCTAPVPRTGQIDSEAAGDDGAIQSGIASPNPRFTDNGDGTVADNLTGLIWLKDANCDGQKDWAAALNFGNALAQPQCGLSDNSSAGDWRLPNIRELQSLIDYGNFNFALPSGHPFIGVQAFYYWSSTSNAAQPTWAWAVPMYDGTPITEMKDTDNFHVWYVRGPQ